MSLVSVGVNQKRVFGSSFQLQQLQTIVQHSRTWSNYSHWPLIKARECIWSHLLGRGGRSGHFREMLSVMFRDKRHHWLFIRSDDRPMSILSMRYCSEQTHFQPGCLWKQHNRSGVTRSLQDQCGFGTSSDLRDSEACAFKVKRGLSTTQPYGRYLRG